MRTVIHSCLVFLFVCAWPSGLVLAADSSDDLLVKCIEQAKDHFKTCLSKAGNEEERAACEKTFDTEYNRCGESGSSKEPLRFNTL